MDMQQHWENKYGTKAPDQVSWFRPHLETSLGLIERATQGDRTAAVIDVGAGASTLVDDLVNQGYRNLTVLDISQAAIDVARGRLGDAADWVRWIRADLTQAPLPQRSFEVWRDHAVFHFLTAPEDRLAYVRTVALALKPGGHVIIGTFGPDGPLKCCGLDVVRYDTDSLYKEFGIQFRLVESLKELHQTRSERHSSFCIATARWNRSGSAFPLS